ncbi:MAG TPA: hypothetical protein VN618_13370 [Solirubrobacteraceae bacterium]|nr:hypothetical protein [Solirubrobacteraceae bacterium]
MAGRAVNSHSGDRSAMAIAALVCFAFVALVVPARARAGTLTFGPALDVPATLDTAENLNYEGTGIQLPGSVFHVNHDGADTVLWNVAQPGGDPRVPAGGQIVSFSLEGCARRPAGAPPPLTQIHFQDLVPSAGGFTIAISSQAFEIPVCGVGGASGSTVTGYAPGNFCVSQGDYVAFNDEGGFAAGEGGPPPYPAGVPYQVIGRVPGASMDSFIRDSGTNNGTAISPSDRTNHDGFATNEGEQLMLQATLATGPDASTSCPGGTKGAAPPPSGYRQVPRAPELQVGKQTDGINHRGIAAIALYCHAAGGCRGTMTLTAAAGHGHGRHLSQSFALPGGTTTHVPIRVPRAIMALARKRRSGVLMRLRVLSGGTVYTQTITLRIF